MNINLTPILQAAVILAAAIITYVVVPWIKANTTEKQRRMIDAVYEALCYAAEQIYGAGNGDEKFRYVCEQLRERGLEVDVARIEATVYENFNFKIPRLGLPETGETEEGETGGTTGEATPQAAERPAPLTRGAEETAEEPEDDLIRPCGPPSPEGEGKGETTEETTEEPAEGPTEENQAEEPQSTPEE